MSSPVIYIKAHQGRKLPSADLNGKSDPYLVFECNGSQGQTQVIKKTLEPVWDSQVTLYPKHAQAGDNLEIKCFDEDTFSKDDLLGLASVSLASFMTSAPAPTWIPLSHGGEIQLTVEVSGVEQPAGTATHAVSSSVPAYAPPAEAPHQHQQQYYTPPAPQQQQQYYAPPAPQQQYYSPPAPQQQYYAPPPSQPQYVSPPAPQHQPQEQYYAPPPPQPQQQQYYAPPPPQPQQQQQYYAAPPPPQPQPQYYPSAAAPQPQPMYPAPQGYGIGGPVPASSGYGVGGPVPAPGYHTAGPMRFYPGFEYLGDLSQMSKSQRKDAKKQIKKANKKKGIKTKIHFGYDS